MGIYTKLLDIQKESTKLKKDANNPFFKSNYITLDNIISTYNTILSEKAIACYHYTKDNKLTTVLIDTEDDTKIESEFNILNNDPQKAGSEITYWKRYNLGQLLNNVFDYINKKCYFITQDWQYYNAEELYISEWYFTWYDFQAKRFYIMWNLKESHKCFDDIADEIFFKKEDAQIRFDVIKEQHRKEKIIKLEKELKELKD